jgi:hypothetical protein
MLHKINNGNAGQPLLEKIKPEQLPRLEDLDVYNN